MDFANLYSLKCSELNTNSNNEFIKNVNIENYLRELDTLDPLYVSDHILNRNITLTEVKHSVLNSKKRKVLDLTVSQMKF